MFASPNCNDSSRRRSLMCAPYRMTRKNVPPRRLFHSFNEFPRNLCGDEWNLHKLSLSHCITLLKGGWTLCLWVTTMSNWLLSYRKSASSHTSSASSINKQSVRWNVNDARIRRSVWKIVTHYSFIYWKKNERSKQEALSSLHICRNINWNSVNNDANKHSLPLSLWPSQPVKGNLGIVNK